MHVCRTFLQALERYDILLAETALSQWTEESSILLETYAIEAETHVWSDFEDSKFEGLLSRKVILRLFYRPRSGSSRLFLKAHLERMCARA